MTLPYNRCIQKLQTTIYRRKDISMLCTVIDIRGDYAFVRYDDTGVISEVALALLPFGCDVGDRLKFENYEFVNI